MQVAGSRDVDAAVSVAGGFDDDAALAALRRRSSSRTSDDLVQGALYVYRALYVTRRYGPGSGRTQQQLAQEIGISEPYLTKLKRLGRAAVVHGVPRDSQLWSMLITYANERAVARALDSDTPVDHARLTRLVEAAIPGRTEPSVAMSPSARVRDVVGSLRVELAALSADELRRTRRALLEVLVEIEDREAAFQGA